MKKIVILIIVFMLVATSALAADVHLRWDATQGATGYKIYMSTDGRQTWDAGVDVGNVTEKIFTGVPETGSVDFKIGAYNPGSEMVADWRGAWYDHTKIPPGYAGGLGIQ